MCRKRPWQMKTKQNFENKIRNEIPKSVKNGKVRLRIVQTMTNLK
jgi:hypothetical protein